MRSSPRSREGGTDVPCGLTLANQIRSTLILITSEWMSITMHIVLWPGMHDTKRERERLVIQENLFKDFCNSLQLNNGANSWPPTGNTFKVGVYKMKNPQNTGLSKILVSFGLRGVWENFMGPRGVKAPPPPSLQIQGETNVGSQWFSLQVTSTASQTICTTQKSMRWRINDVVVLWRRSCVLCFGQYVHQRTKRSPNSRTQTK